MIRLSRDIRFSLSGEITDTRNSWAGWPASDRLAPFLKLQCVVEGTPDPVTGYLCDIKELDRFMRDIVIQDLFPMADSSTTLEAVLATVVSRAKQAWKQPIPIAQFSLHVSPYHSYTTRMQDPDMVTLTQQFEFSAAHRLHNPELSDERNREIYGKCNNPNGHGHNYVVEVSIARQKTDSFPVHDLHEFQTTVNRLVIDRLDHKNLNEDIEYFGEVLPSVENIAVAIWNWLDGEFGEAQLENIRVYETPKTWAEYSG